MTKNIMCSFRLVFVFTLLTLVSGCATTGATDSRDPFEGFNRGVFKFNETMDDALFTPVGKFYQAITPDFVDRGVTNFFSNLGDIAVVANDLMQFKAGQAISDAARFIFNSTIGLLGVVDVSTTMGLPKHNEDFGQTLGYWGIPTGPYLVLPFFGPSSARDAVGLAADSAALVYPYFLPFWVSRTITLGGLLNWRSLKLVEIAAEREAALDYYVAIRNAYVSFRENEVWDSEEDELDGDDLYYLE